MVACIETGANKMTRLLWHAAYYSGKTNILNLQCSGKTTYSHPPKEWNEKVPHLEETVQAWESQGSQVEVACLQEAAQNTLAAASMEGLCMCQSQAAPGCRAFLPPDILRSTRYAWYRTSAWPTHAESASSWLQPATCRQQTCRPTTDPRSGIAPVQRKQVDAHSLAHSSDQGCMYVFGLL